MPGDAGVEDARRRLAHSQAALLSSLVAGAPLPPGFDGARVRAQADALAAKRADVVARVAPELPRILGAAYRPAFHAYALGHPLPGGYRRDALDFAEQVLRFPGAAGIGPRARRRLRRWWTERSGPAPSLGYRLRRLLRPAAR